MRYKSAKLRIDKNGKRYYKPTIVPNILIKDSDVFIYPRYGDRFDIIANRYYGDSNLWWIIAKANEMSGGQISPNPEVKLRIPMVIDDILEAVNISNS